MKATWNGAVLAESDQTVVVEGNHYFPPDAIKAEYFKPSDTHTVCGWKGTASYYTVEVNGQRIAGTYRYTRVWAREADDAWRVVGGHVSQIPGG